VIMKTASARDAATAIIKKLHRGGHVAYLAGGCVRDELLGITPKDYDVATDARPERVEELFKRTERVGARFGVMLVRCRGVSVEVATFRSDGPYTDGRHPQHVVFGDDRSDARRRDFTINGMFLDVSDGHVIDYVGGRDDLTNRVIRAIDDPDRRFAEDHLRMMRAVRFAARLDFEIAPATFAGMVKHAPSLAKISPERVREELRLILTDAGRAKGWRLLLTCGLTGYLVSDTSWSGKPAAAVTRRLAALVGPISTSLAFSAILEPFETTMAERFCRQLRCSNQERRDAVWLLSNLPLVHRPDDLELADVKLLMADGRFQDLMRLLRADIEATGATGAAHASLMIRCNGIPPDAISPLPLVTGEDLIACGLPQGPAYSRLISALYRGQLNGELLDRASALSRLDELIREFGESANEPMGQ